MMNLTRLVYSLLPEGLLAFAEEIVEQRRDVVRERVSVEIVVRRIVAIVGVQVDLNVVDFATVLVEHCFDFVAEVAFDFEHQSAYVLVWIVGPVGDALLGVGIDAAAGLASADRTEDGYPSEQSAFWNGKPIRLLGGHGLSRVMDFSEH
jgi:hypothetical protein